MGFKAEALVKRRLADMGYKPCRLPSSAKLLAIAAKLAPKRVQRAMEALDEEGTDIRDLSSYDLLDLVYGLDTVIMVKGKVVGIDVTLVDDQRLVSKRNKLVSLKPLHQAIGIQKSILFNPNKEDLLDVIADLEE